MLLGAPLWYAKLNKAARQQNQLYLCFSPQIQGPTHVEQVKSSVSVTLFTVYHVYYCMYIYYIFNISWNLYAFGFSGTYKEIKRLTRKLPASSQEHRCCHLHSPTESEPKWCTVGGIKVLIDGQAMMIIK